MGKQNNTRGKKRFTKRDEKALEDKHLKERRYDKANNNDPAWYTRNELLVRDAGRLSFSQPTGQAIDLKCGYPNTKFYGGEDRFIIPGTMGLKFLPTYGMSEDNFSALNVAAQNLYSNIRYANSGHGNYDTPDLMLYVMAMDQIYMLYSHLVRAYGSVQLVSQVNKNLPRVLLNAMGFDYDELRANLANMRYRLNAAAAKIGTFAVPNTMPIFARHIWMASNIFADGPDPKAQTYVFRPIAFGKYNEKSSDHGGFLEAKFMNYVHDLDDWFALLDEMIAAVRASEDCGIMSGDIIKASKGDRPFELVTIPGITAGFETAITYSEEVLGQITNATIVGEALYPVVSEDVPQACMFKQDVNTNALISTLEFRKPGSATGFWDQVNSMSRIMVGLSATPDESEVLVNSRLMIAGFSNAVARDGNVYFKPRSIGSEVVTQAVIYGTNMLEGHWDDTNPGLGTRRSFEYFENVGVSDLNFAVGKIALLSQFRLHPQYLCTVSVGTNLMINPIVEVDNYSIVDDTDLMRMHETATLSLFNVPMIAYR